MTRERMDVLDQLHRENLVRVAWGEIQWASR